MKITQYFSFFSIALPVVLVTLYFWVFVCYAVNAPQLDDYMDLLVVMPDYVEAAGLRQKWHILFQQYHEHRYLTGHLLSALFVEIFGVLDFRFLMGAGNLALLGFAVLLVREFSGAGYRAVMMPVTALLLFNLQAQGSMFWATAAWAHYALLFFSMAAFTLIAAEKALHRYIPAFGFCALAVFTQANGLFVAVLVVFFCLFEFFDKESHKAWPLLVFWLCAASLMGAAYFHDFDTSQRVGETHLSVPDQVRAIVEHPLNVLMGFLLFLGGVFVDMDDRENVLALLFGCFSGAMVVSAFCWLVLCYKTRKLYPLKMLMLLIFASAASVACLRASVMGVDQALQGHYKIYSLISVLFVFFVALLWAERHSARTRLLCNVLACLMAAGVYGVSCATNLPGVEQKRTAIVDDFNYWLERNNLKRASVRFFVPQYNRKLNRAVSVGVYSPEVLLLPSRQVAVFQSVDACPQGLVVAEGLALSYKPGAWGVAVRGEIPFDVDRDEGQEVWLCAGKTVFYLALAERNLQWSEGARGRVSVDVLVPRALFPKHLRPERIELMIRGSYEK
ncbi:MAG: hypothetical protein KDI30_10815 [Pseudomonadales bacterium]|nr:hypothetical protein [Pseudomonadales bacterium]